MTDDAFKRQLTGLVAFYGPTEQGALDDLQTMIGKPFIDPESGRCCMRLGSRSGCDEAALYAVPARWIRVYFRPENDRDQLGPDWARG